MQNVLAPNCSKNADFSNSSTNGTLNEDQYSDYEEDGWPPFSRFINIVTSIQSRYTYV